VASRTEQLSVLSRHLISVSEEEKARLARELHDEMGANLTAIGMHLSASANRSRPAIRNRPPTLARARATLLETVQLKRRIIEDLRPSLLDNMGLSAALQSYCEDFGRTTGVDCDALIEDCEVDTPARCRRSRCSASCRNPQQCRQIRPAQHVVVHLAREGEAFALEVSDDGVGIPPDAMRVRSRTACWACASARPCWAAACGWSAV
jgi:signal transduction histidine kinase